MHILFSQVTYKRYDEALTRLGARDDSCQLRAVLFGHTEPYFFDSVSASKGCSSSTTSTSGFVAMDSALNASQREAVQFALKAKDVALIHGPPGTGKVRCW